MGISKTDAYATAADTDSSSASNLEEAIVTPIKSWKGYIWDTWGLPRDQHRLLFKIDPFVLTFASVGSSLRDSVPFSDCLDQLGYFLKNLDQNNVNNAFLSGMRQSKARSPQLAHLLPPPSLRHLEQRQSPASHGLLTQELQQGTLPRARHALHRPRNQQPPARNKRALHRHGAALGLALPRPLPRRPLALHLRRCRHDARLQRRPTQDAALRRRSPPQGALLAR
jgi:hypothetical protein